MPNATKLVSGEPSINHTYYLVDLYITQLPIRPNPCVCWSMSEYWEKGMRKSSTGGEEEGKY